MGCGSGGCGTNSKDGVPSGCQSHGSCSSGGCNRMNVHDWLANLPFSDPESGCRVIEVSFNNGSRKEFFRNTTLTDYKVNKTLLLIRKIDEINSISELQELIGNAQEDSMLSKANFNSGNFTCLEKCMRIIDSAQTGESLDYRSSFYQRYFSCIWSYN